MKQTFKAITLMLLLGTVGAAPAMSTGMSTGVTAVLEGGGALVSATIAAWLFYKGDQAGLSDYYPPAEELRYKLPAMIPIAFALYLSYCAVSNGWQALQPIPAFFS
jgi:hypothetical protein